MFVLSITLFSFSFWSKNNDKDKKKLNKEEALGEKLFFDKILSEDFSLSCASCHKPAFAFADTQALSVGVKGNIGERNTPSVMNMAMRDFLFWDGRANTLEAQVVFPIENPKEMNLKFALAVDRIQKNKNYQKLFLDCYKQQPDSILIIKAIAAFERTLETDKTPNDRWLNDIEPSGMTAAMQRGRDIFVGDKAKCFDCHFTPDFTADEFRNIGLFNGKELNDSGRYLITKNIEDIGKFKTPGLRNVAVTAPYMHNGMFKTLREVIDFYDNPLAVVPNAIGKDAILPNKLNLTEQEKDDLEAFLNALTDDRFKQ